MSRRSADAAVTSWLAGASLVSWILFFCGFAMLIRRASPATPSAISYKLYSTGTMESTSYVVARQLTPERVIIRWI